MDSVLDELRDLEKRNLKRSLIVADGVDFCSNDYLGLSKSDFIREKLIEFLDRTPHLGGQSSRLIRGHSEIHWNVEVQLAKFVRAEKALLFSSGYMANVGVFSSLCKNAVVFSDEFNHASLIDGIRLSGARCSIFRHNDMNHLESLLRNENSESPRWIVTESVFSMDGDLAPLTELLDICERWNAGLILDEAHATGVFGEKGEGRLSSLNYDPEKTVAVHTCGKGLGAMGAFVSSSPKVNEFLINKCRTFIYSTAVSPFMAQHILFAVEECQKRNDLRIRLQENLESLRLQWQQFEGCAGVFSQIVPIFVGDNSAAMQASTLLRQKGLDVRAIRYPTVPKGSARLRVSIHADHTEEQIQNLTQQLCRLDGNSLNGN